MQTPLQPPTAPVRRGPGRAAPSSRRHLRVQLYGVEGQLLPREAVPQEDAAPSTPSGCRPSRSTTTFYRMPTERLLAGWSDLTPDHFRFTLKAPRRITHEARLRDTGDPTGAFCVPPGPWGRSSACCCSSSRRRSGRTSTSSTTFSPCSRPASGPRSSSDMRRGTTPRCSNACVPGSWPCASPTARRMTTPMEVTADYAYFRLRDEGYRPEDIARWAETIAAGTRGLPRGVRPTSSTRTRGKGPEFARQFVEALSGSGQESAP